MKVTGKRTTVENVSIELDKEEISRILNQTGSIELINILRERLLQGYLKTLMKYETERKLLVYPYQWYISDVERPGNYDVLTLVEKDGDTDWNGDRENKIIRKLTSYEIEEYNEIMNFPGSLGVYII